ncbi:hypothetical protein Acr_00g0074110 [Actinidia rufa]|uniref:Uncharacterized protein n=1 Tax=Actinidia rufa TaxID=165716 RepID=A0A7J0DSB0_9ERIC|nr:hypothetical protein Acr_00g0074110 [Actinidia rufa]
MLKGPCIKPNVGRGLCNLPTVFFPNLILLPEPTKSDNQKQPNQTPKSDNQKTPNQKPPNQQLESTSRLPTAIQTESTEKVQVIGVDGDEDSGDWAKTMEFLRRRLSQNRIEGTTVIPPPCGGPRDHERGYPCPSHLRLLLDLETNGRKNQREENSRQTREMERRGRRNPGDDHLRDHLRMPNRVFRVSTLLFSSFGEESLNPTYGRVAMQ